MEDKNKALVKIAEAMDAAGYVVKSVQPERRPNGDGYGFTEDESVLLIRIVPADAD